MFLFYVLTSFVSSVFAGYFSGNDTNLLEKLNFVIPDLSPDVPNSKIDVLSGLDPQHSLFFKQIFSKAFYNSECDKNNITIIKPIYYWPGEQVDLPCMMCKIGNAYNGKMKYWSVLHFDYFIKNFDPFKISEKGNWMIINNSTAEEMRAKFEKVIFMPLFDPTSIGYRTRNRRSNIRPRMRFIQRDGRLKILTSEAGAYGLYKCFDELTKNTKFIYYLIPILPVYYMHNAKIHRAECSMGRYSEINNFFHLDSNNLFRIISPTFWNSSKGANNYCPLEWGNCTLSMFKPTPIDLITSDVYHLNFSRIGTNTKKKFDLNLKIFVHWSEWSDCNIIKKYRTRQGFCNIGKIDKTKVYRTTTNEHRLLQGLNLLWILEVHRILETIDDFSLNGIPLFSGVLSNLLAMDNYPVSQCIDFNHVEIPKAMRDNFNTLWDLILDPIIELGAWQTYKDLKTDQLPKLTMTPCFYFNNTDKGMKENLYAYTLNQNENCS